MLCLEVFPPLAFGSDLLEAGCVLLLAVNSHVFYVCFASFFGWGAQYGVLWRSNFNFFYGRGGDVREKYKKVLFLVFLVFLVFGCWFLGF